MTQQMIVMAREYGKQDGKLTVTPMNKPIERPRSHMVSVRCFKSDHLRFCWCIIHYLMNEDKTCLFQV